MSEINPAGRPEMNGVQPNKPAASPKAQAQQSNQAPREDSVQLSSHARLLSKIRENPIREELVSRVRDEIDRGQYETDAKINTAIDELRADLG